jgi:hypothetical protein
MRLVLSEWARVISNSRMGYPQEEGGEDAPIGAQVASAQPCRSNFNGLWLRFNLLVTTRQA